MTWVMLPNIVKASHIWINQGKTIKSIKAKTRNNLNGCPNLFRIRHLINYQDPLRNGWVTVILPTTDFTDFLLQIQKLQHSVTFDSRDLDICARRLFCLTRRDLSNEIYVNCVHVWTKNAHSPLFQQSMLVRFISKRFSRMKEKLTIEK